MSMELLANGQVGFVDDRRMYTTSMANRFVAALSDMALVSAARRSTIERALSRAVAAIRAGEAFAEVVGNHATRLNQLFPDDPQLGRLILVESTNVLIAASMELGNGFSSHLVETVSPVETRPPIIRVVRDEAHFRDIRLLAESITTSGSTESALEALCETDTVGVCIIGLDGTFIRVNQRFLSIHGLTAPDMTGVSAREFLTNVYHMTNEQLETMSEHTSGNRPRMEMEVAIRRPDDALAWVFAESAVVNDESGEARFYLGLVEDVTDRNTALRMQRNSEERIQALIRNSSDVIGIITEQGTVAYISESIQRILGHDPVTLLDSNVLDLLAEESHDRLDNIFQDVIKIPRGTTQASARLRHADGTWRWMEIDFTNLSDVPSVGGVVVTARDVTRKKSIEQQLERLAYFDALTGLPNRAQFRHRLEQAMGNIESDGRRLAVIFLDLDHFKMVNDRYGHDRGDRLLEDVARRIEEDLQPGEMVARLGGDEFALLVEDATPSRAMRTANRVLSCLNKSSNDQISPMATSASAGVAVSSPLLNDSGELLRAADIALYQAKAEGGDAVALFEPRMYDEAFGRAELERSLRFALERSEMVPHFQPEYTFRTGELCCLEVLVRWHRQDGRIIMPEAFLDVAAELGILAPLGLNVLRQAVGHLATWRASDPIAEHLTMSFNISQAELSQKDYVQTVKEILSDAGVPPSVLSIEIHDSFFRNPIPQLDKVVGDLKAAGISVIIDHFDGGYASWSQARRLGVPHAKIDRKAIAWTDAQDDDLSVVKAIVSMARAAGVRVTAVGLDSEALVQRSRDIGCHRGQGIQLGGVFDATEVPSLWR